MRNKAFDDLLKNAPEDTGVFTKWYGDLLLRINRLIHEKGIKLEDVEESSEILKWMRGDFSLDLRSLAKLSVELEDPLIEIYSEKRFCVVEEVQEGYWDQITVPLKTFKEAKTYLENCKKRHPEAFIVSLNY